MARKNNRKCICCSVEYRYCNTCNEDKMKPVWHTIYHNENCKDIFNTASDYLAGAITKEEARQKFDACDLSYKNKLHNKIVEAINAVYDVKVEIKNVVETVAENKEEVVEDKASVETEKVGHKRFDKK